MLHGLNQAIANPDFFSDDNQDCYKLSELAEQVTKYAEVVRSRELHTFKGHIKSIIKLKKFQLMIAAGTHVSKSR
jgi:hypothetical protein